jgi:non-homologous end joining protein Ku
MKIATVESSKVIDLEKFVSRGDIDPVYFDSPYYLYPDGPIAVEALRIRAAMAEAGVAGIGRLTLSRRERVVMVESRGTGMALFTLRAEEEIRQVTPQAAAIVERAHHFDVHQMGAAEIGVVDQDHVTRFEVTTTRYDGLGRELHDPDKNRQPEFGLSQARVRSTTHRRGRS